MTSDSILSAGCCNFLNITKTFQMLPTWLTLIVLLAMVIEITIVKLLDNESYLSNIISQFADNNF